MRQQQGMRRSTRRIIVTIGSLVCVALAASACSSSGTSNAGTSGSSAANSPAASSPAASSSSSAATGASSSAATSNSAASSAASNSAATSAAGNTGAASASGSAAPSASAATSAAVSSSSAPTGSGTVDVLYAGSLVDLMQKQIGPGFKTATGYSVTGYSGGSTALVTQIKGKVHKGDIFISAAPSANASLEGASNGSWVSWYGSFATSGLVIGYNPKSKFAADLKTKPWYDVITESGFRLGSTDPATDPKGKLAAQALADTATKQNLPALKALSTDQSIFFPEETLVGRLQAGQLDAGFFYNSEAVAAGIPTVPVTGEDLKATYTVTILANAPHEAGAEAFVAYLLGPAGQAVLKQDGFTLITPATLSGSGVPSSLQSLLS